MAYNANGLTLLQTETKRLCPTLLILDSRGIRSKQQDSLPKVGLIL